MDQAFFEVIVDGNMLLEETFSMEIFTPIASRVKPFRDYLKYMFENKKSNAVGSRKEEEKVLPFHKLKDQLFYPDRVDIMQTNEFAAELASEAAAIFRREFRDTSKATATYLNDVNGERCMNKVSEKERKDGLGVSASNCISESLHGMVTQDKQMFGTIDIQHSAAGGHARSINLFGRGEEELVKGNKRKNEQEVKEEGGFYQLPKELAETAIITAKIKREEHRKQFIAARDAQMAKKTRKEELVREKALNAAQETSFEALVFFQQYGSDRCWRTVTKARSIYKRLIYESRRLEAVKVRFPLVHRLLRASKMCLVHKLKVFELLYSFRSRF